MAIAPATYNQTEATNQVRVAYGVGTARPGFLGRMVRYVPPGYVTFRAITIILWMEMRS